MADDPNQKMDELLKAYAQKRREHPDAARGFEMHPATRRMLQGEVAKLRPRAQSSGSSWRLWLSLWPRIGFAVSILIVMGVVYWSLRPPPQPYQMAQSSIVLTDHSGSNAELAANQKAVKETEDLVMLREERAPQANPNRQPQTPDDARKKLKPSDELRRGRPSEAPVAPATQEADRDKLGDARNAQITEARKDLAHLDGVAPPPNRQANKQESESLSRENGKMPVGAAGRQLDRAQLAEVAKSDFAKTLNAGIAPTNEAFFSRFARVAGGALGATTNPVPALVTAQTATEPAGSLAFAADQTELKRFYAFEETSAVPAQAQLALIFRRLEPAERSVRLRESNVAEDRSAPPKVLDTFNFEQFGERVRLTDSDGSVYEGTVAGAGNRTNVLQDADPGAGSGRRGIRMSGTDSNSVSFTARGTNRSLNQLVTLTGRLLSEAEGRDAFRTGGAGGSAPINTRSLGIANSPRPETPNVRLKARVVVGGTNQVNIEAIRVQR